MNTKKKLLYILVGVLVVAGLWFLWVWFALGDDAASNTSDQQQDIASFEECVAAGHPVMESHPRRCSAPDGQTFVEELPEDDSEAETPQEGVFASEKGVEIHLDLAEGQTISSPFTLSGEVPGNWSFEADFPVELVDANGNQLTEVPAQLQGDWMTEELVPFEVELTFSQPQTDTGTLILHNANPSGLPEHDDKLEVPVMFNP